jgi:hypothetical protein
MRLGGDCGISTQRAGGPVRVFVCAADALIPDNHVTGNDRMSSGFPQGSTRSVVMNNNFMNN